MSSTKTFRAIGTMHPADAFDDQNIALCGHRLDCGIDGVPFDRLFGAFGGDGGGQRFGKPLRADGIEREFGIGMMGEKLGILADQAFSPSWRNRWRSVWKRRRDGCGGETNRRWRRRPASCRRRCRCR